MNDQQLLRYSRQIMLAQFGFENQQILLDSHVLLTGLGGLGSPVAMYLAAAGVGTITLVDHDQVDLSNLQRQIIHRTANIGLDKVNSAKNTLQALNPDIQIHTVNHKLDAQALNDYCNNADVVVDATDNFDIRFALNKSCIDNRKPFVSGAAIRMEGQVSVFGLHQQHSPCYRCLYPELSEMEQSCSENGVLAPVVGIIGSIQALETIKILTGIGKPLDSRLLLLDAERMEWREIKLQKDPNCPACSPVC